MKVVYEFTDGDIDVKLEQRASGKFRVTYGVMVEDNLDYTEAAAELGQCIMHSLQCASKIHEV